MRPRSHQPGKARRCRSKAKRPPRSATPSKTAAKPPEGTETPSSTRKKPGLSPVAWDWATIGKVLPGIIKAVAVLIDAILKPK